VTDDPLERIVEPFEVYSRADVLERPSPVPTRPGIYGWYFRQLPDMRIDVTHCVSFEEMHLLYVGIAPKAPPSIGTASRQSLRTRIRYHYRGNAYGSTLRLTLGCLLADRLGIRLCRVGSGTRLTFTKTGEKDLSAWMAANAYVAWAETPEPWAWEERALASLDLPLNLQGNARHGFHPILSAVRAAAKASARAGGIFA
jgi:hypothetical protein